MPEVQPLFVCLKRLLLWCAFSNIAPQSRSNSRVWNIYHLRLSSNWLTEDQYANLPRAALELVQVVSCTRAPSWGVRELSPTQLHSQAETPAQAASRRKVCVYSNLHLGQGRPWVSFWSSLSQRSQRLVFISSPPTLWMFFKEEDMPMAKLNSFWRYVSWWMREKEKRTEGKREREKIKRRETRLPFCLVNCGFIVLPWTQLQRGRKSIFFYYAIVRKENLFVNWIKPNKSMSVYSLRTRKISHRYNYIIQQCN